MIGMIELGSILQLILNSIFTGIGVSIGNYFANKHLIERIEKTVNKKQKDGKP